jgi:fumarate reductase flavoprotein subunit
VILAVNDCRKSLVRRFCPEIAGAQYFGSRGSTGEAVLWGERLGAGLSNMAAYQGYAAVADPHGSLLSWTTIEKGGILVDQNARRFGDESLGYSGYARNVLAQGNIAPRCSTSASSTSPGRGGVRRLFRYGGLKTGVSPAKIAATCGLDAAALGETVADYNAARGGASDAFGQCDFGQAPLAPPYYGCRVCPGCTTPRAGSRSIAMRACSGRTERSCPICSRAAVLLPASAGEPVRSCVRKRPALGDRPRAAGDRRRARSAGAQFVTCRANSPGLMRISALPIPARY